MRRMFRKAELMSKRGIICPEERKITSELASEKQEKDVVNLAVFVHNANVEEEKHR